MAVNSSEEYIHHTLVADRNFEFFDSNGKISESRKINQHSDI